MAGLLALAPWQDDAVAQEAALPDLATVRRQLRSAPMIDVHSHAGRFMMASGDRRFGGSGTPTPPLDQRIAEMARGGVDATMLSIVADLPILAPGKTGLDAVRGYAPGEAYADCRRQLAVVRDAEARGKIRICRTSRDILAAKRAGRPACLISVEGGDFIEGDLARIRESLGAGVRSITLVHYAPNQIGDPQTRAPEHGGLSPLGHDVVRAMDRTGILIDLSHASLDTTRQAADIARRPMLISHSNLQRPGLDHPRLISLEHARIVTRSGGVIGTLPGGAGIDRIEDYIDMLFRHVDLLGIDHVAIGTDMDFTFRSSVDSYDRWLLVPTLLLARGMHRAEVAKIIGGNFLRILNLATS